MASRPHHQTLVVWQVSGQTWDQKATASGRPVSQPDFYFRRRTQAMRPFAHEACHSVLPAVWFHTRRAEAPSTEAPRPETWPVIPGWFRPVEPTRHVGARNRLRSPAASVAPRAAPERKTLPSTFQFHSTFQDHPVAVDFGLVPNRFQFGSVPASSSRGVQEHPRIQTFFQG